MRLKRMEQLELFEKVANINVVAAIHMQIEELVAEQMLVKHDEHLEHEFRDVFKPVINVKNLPWDMLAEIKLKNTNHAIKTWMYQCPQKYCEAWKMLIDEHLDAGCIQPSALQFVSPAFLIPKVNPTMLLCWVNDDQALNAVTILDNHPILRVEDILHDCVKGKFSGVLDLTNTFF